MHDLVEFNTCIETAAASPLRNGGALPRQATIDDKIAVSLAYSSASQQTGGTILDAQTIGNAAYKAAIAMIQGVTSDPGTVSCCDHRDQHCCGSPRSYIDLT